MKIRTKLFAATACALFAIAPSFSAADEGKELYASKNCQTCHGPEGRKPILASYPRLAGQNKEYLISQIKDIRDGRRSNSQSATMRAMVQGLGDAQAEAIAEFLSKVE